MAIAVRERGGHLSFGAIWGGTAAGLGLWLLLGLFGVWIWLLAIRSPNGANMWLFIWTLILPLICCTFGAVVGSLGAGPASRGRGALHGIASWGSTIVLAGVTAIAGSFFVAQGSLGFGPAAAIDAVLGVATAGSVTGMRGALVRLDYYSGFMTLSILVAFFLSMGAGLLGARRHEALIEREVVRREGEEEFHAPH